MNKMLIDEFKCLESWLILGFTNSRFNDSGSRIGGSTDVILPNHSVESTFACGKIDPLTNICQWNAHALSKRRVFSLKLQASRRQVTKCGRYGVYSI